MRICLNRSAEKEDDVEREELPWLWQNIKNEGEKRERDRGARTHKKTMTDYERRKKMNRIMENAWTSGPTICLFHRLSLPFGKAESKRIQVIK